MTTVRVQSGIIRPGVCSVAFNVGSETCPCLSQGLFRAPTFRHAWKARPDSTLEVHVDGSAENRIESGENRLKMPKKSRCCGCRRLSTLQRRPNRSRVLEPHLRLCGYWAADEKPGNESLSRPGPARLVCDW